MNTLRNSVQLIGNIGKEIELKTASNGAKYTRISLATNDFYKNAQGEKVQETQWHNLIAFGKTAEFMAKYLSKGAEIIAQGKIEYSSYTDKDGVKRYSTDIKVSEFQSLTKKSTASGGGDKDNLPF
jgi:single-strand DNA-binding protein